MLRDKVLTLVGINCAVVALKSCESAMSECVYILESRKVYDSFPRFRGRPRTL